MTAFVSGLPSTVVRLDASALNEARSILFNAYREVPAFEYVMDVRRPGYDKRVRGIIREMINLHERLQQDAIGLLVEARLVAVAFVGVPLLTMGPVEQWKWRLRLTLSTGVASTLRCIEYHEKLRELLPEGEQWHELPLLGVDPAYQNRGLGRMLMGAVERLCRENPRSSGIVVDSGINRYIEFYQSLGYRELGEINLDQLEERVLYKSLDDHAAPITDGPTFH